MSVTTDAVRSAVEDYTGLSWQVDSESDGRIVLSRASFVYEFEKVGDKSWELNIYDEKDSLTEAKWSVSPVAEENVVSEVRQFTPKKLQRK